MQGMLSSLLKSQPLALLFALVEENLSFETTVLVAVTVAVFPLAHHRKYLLQTANVFVLTSTSATMEMVEPSFQTALVNATLVMEFRS